jgi:TfoX/Sxy family transcriptional regulator of competence genes
MPFAKSPPELVARFDELAARAPEAKRKAMFGFPSLVVDGHIFMGLYEDHLVLRLAADDRTALLQLGGEVFSPMPGRPMKDYVVVPPALVADTDGMGPWVARALAYAESLPPKPPKAVRAAKVPTAAKPAQRPRS